MYVAGKDKATAPSASKYFLSKKHKGKETEELTMDLLIWMGVFGM